MAVGTRDRIVFDASSATDGPLLRDTGVRVSQVLLLLSAGADADSVIARYPALERDDVLAVTEYLVEVVGSSSVGTFRLLGISRRQLIALLHVHKIPRPRRAAESLNRDLSARKRPFPAMQVFGVNGIFVTWPGDWPFFTGTGRVYAHDPDCRSGFVFTVWPKADEDSARTFAKQYHGVHHCPFGARAWLERPEALQLSPVEREEHQGQPMFSTNGTYVSEGATVGYAAVALEVAAHPTPGSVAAMVSASSIDGPAAARDLARTLAIGCHARAAQTDG